MARRLCLKCKVYINESNWARHLNTAKHQNTGKKVVPKKDKKKKVVKGSQNFSLVIRNVFQRKFKFFHKLRNIIFDNKEAFQRIIVSREWGLNNRGHLHVFVKTLHRYKLKEIREFIIEVIRVKNANLVVVQTVKNVSSIVKYVTKEDMNCLYYNVSPEHFHINWKLNNIVHKSMYLNRTSYLFMSIPQNYHKQLFAMHAAFWNLEHAVLNSVAASPHKHTGLVGKIRDFINLDRDRDRQRHEALYDDELRSPNGTLLSSEERMQLFRSILPSKKGFWIWGESGFGKSATVLNLFPNHYTFLSSSKFPMTSFEGQTHIVWDEGTCAGYESHRNLILQLTSGYSATGEIKGGPLYQVKMNGYFVVTSNEAPPTAPEFIRRFHIIHCSYPFH